MTPDELRRMDRLGLDLAQARADAYKATSERDRARSAAVALEQECAYLTAVLCDHGLVPGIDYRDTVTT
jgi:hypothetical protein